MTLEEYVVETLKDLEKQVKGLELRLEELNLLNKEKDKIIEVFKKHIKVFKSEMLGLEYIRFDVWEDNKEDSEDFKTLKALLKKVGLVEKVKDE